MSTPNDALTAQLAQELATQIHNWERIAGTLASFQLATATAARLPEVAAELCDAITGLDMADAIIGILFAGKPPSTWWRTPTGRACARQVAPHVTGTVTFRDAATILGRTKRTVEDLVTRKVLQRPPEGAGILLRSVLARLAEQPDI